MKTKSTPSPKTTRNAAFIGDLTYTELSSPNGKRGILVRTNDERIKAEFPGKNLSGIDALLRLASGQYRLLDLEIPTRGASKRELENLVAEVVLPRVLANVLH